MSVDIKKKLNGWLFALQMGANDDDIISQMIDLVYEYHKEKTIIIFLQIQELERQSKEKELAIMYHGLEDSLHNFASLTRAILDEKTSKQAKSKANEFINSDNLAYLIGMCMAYFPKGIHQGASNNGRWILNSFVEILRKNKEKYVEGGESYEWTEMMGYVDYINLIIKEHNL